MTFETTVWEGKIKLFLIEDEENQTDRLRLTDIDFDVDNLCEGLLALNSFKEDQNMLQAILDSLVGILERKKAEIINTVGG